MLVSAIRGEWFHIINTNGYASERQLHPSIYKKIRKTNNILKGKVRPHISEDVDGLDLDTYHTLQKRWQNNQIEVEEKRLRLINRYGSLKEVPPSKGPCKNLEEPVIGTKKALVLLIEFQDKKHTISDSRYFQDLLFSKGSNYSMRDYFLEASWNQLDVNGEVSDKWYTSSLRYSQYLDDYSKRGNRPQAQKLVTEAIIQAKNSNKFDFSSYSNKGQIELLLVVYAGHGFDTKLNQKYIWPHTHRLKEPYEIQEGIWVDRYALIPELPSDDVGCACHELGHLLGLPDLYNEEHGPVIGSWCLMSYGCYNNNSKTPCHPSAWCKIHLGWLKPQLIESTLQTYEIPSIIDEKIIYKIDIKNSNGKEYFLLENRQQNGFDKYLPGHGLLIWHVNEDACKLSSPNSDPNHFFVTLEESDGRNELQSNQITLNKKIGNEKARKVLTGDIGDAFPGETINRTFNDFTNPNSNSVNEYKSGVVVTSISDSNDIMNAGIGVLPVSKEQDIYRMESAAMSKTSIKLFSKNFLTFILQDAKDPYQEGKADFIEDLKEQNRFKSFQDGYRKGYRRGLLDAIKDLKK